MINNSIEIKSNLCVIFAQNSVLKLWKAGLSKATIIEGLYYL
ncbi:MAG: hypothetical protein ACOX7R_09445 [Acetivibrionales bacterium]